MELNWYAYLWNFPECCLWISSGYPYIVDHNVREIVVHVILLVCNMNLKVWN